MYLLFYLKKNSVTFNYLQIYFEFGKKLKSMIKSNLENLSN